MHIFLSILSGVLLILSFPKAGLFPLAWVALVPLFYVLSQTRSAKFAFTHTYLCGVVFSGGFFYWVLSLYRFAGWSVIFGWAALALFQALFFGMFGIFYAKLISGSEEHRKKGLSLILVPSFWVLMEWLRALGPFGVTGGDLGYSQAAFLPLIQMAQYFGVYGISFLIVLFNFAVLELAQGLRYRFPTSWPQVFFEGRVGFSRFGLVILLISSIIFWGLTQLYVPNLRHEDDPLIRVALIQANITQDDKLDGAKSDQILKKHIQLTERLAGAKVSMIFWPETAVTKYLMRHPDLVNKISELAVSNHAYFFVGAPHLEYKFRDKEKSFLRRIYNSIFCFSPSGQLMGRYDKQNLVPFGEYLPARALIYPFLKDNQLFGEDFDGNPNFSILDTHLSKVGAVVCFESTFPSLARSRVLRGANFILVATNDAWFGRTAAAAQHFQCAALRAVENGRFVVQVANTGISGVFDDRGRLLSRTELEEDAVLIAEIKSRKDITFYSRFGEVFIYIIILGFAGWGGWWVYRKRRKLV